MAKAKNHTDNIDALSILWHSAISAFVKQFMSDCHNLRSWVIRMTVIAMTLLWNRAQGSITIHRCSIENQKDAFVIDIVQR